MTVPPLRGGGRPGRTNALSAEDVMAQALSKPEMGQASPAAALGIDGLELVLQPAVAGERVLVWRPREEDLRYPHSPASSPAAI